MIRMQNKQQIEHLGGNFINLEIFGRHREKHVQQIFRVIQVVARIRERLSERVLVGRGGDRRDLGNHPVCKDVPVTRIVDVRRVVVERRHRAHDPRNHCHRMRIVMKPVEQSQHRFVDHRMRSNGGFESVQLIPGRQIPREQQVTDLDERAFFGQLTDRVTSIQ